MSQQGGKTISFEFDEARGIFVVSSTAGLQIKEAQGPITDANGNPLVSASEQNNGPVVASSTPAIGELVKGEGIYFGYHPVCHDPVWRGDPVWPRDVDKIVSEPIRDNDGEIIRHHFFASPEDLRYKNGWELVMSFNPAAKAIGNLRNYYGHDGEYFANNNAFIQALAKGQYNGGWRPGSSDVVDHMYHARHEGEFKGTFDESGCITSGWYGSSSKNADLASHSWQQFFVDGYRDQNREDSLTSWRPIRSKPSLEAYEP